MTLIPETLNFILLFQINNTLQVILATDRVRTVAIFLYNDIQWGQEAQIGFNNGDGYTSFTIPEALSIQALNVDETSNVGTPGVYVFQIDGMNQFLSLKVFQTYYTL